LHAPIFKLQVIVCLLYFLFFKILFRTTNKRSTGAPRAAWRAGVKYIRTILALLWVF